MNKAKIGCVLGRNKEVGNYKKTGPLDKMWTRKASVRTEMSQELKGTALVHLEDQNEPSVDITIENGIIKKIMN